MQVAQLAIGMRVSAGGGGTHEHSHTLRAGAAARKSVRHAEARAENYVTLIMSSLRVRLLLLVAVVLVPSFVLLVALIGRERQVRVDAAQATAVQFVDIGVREQQAAIDDGLRILRAIGMLQQIRGGETEACQRALGTLSNMIEEGWSVVRTRADGIQDCATRGTETLPRSVANDARFLTMRETRVPVIGNYTRSAITGELLLPVNAPLLSETGQFEGALSAGLRMRWFDQLVATLSESSNAVAMIATARGEVLQRFPTHSAAERASIPEPIAANLVGASRGVVDAVGSDGVRRVWAYDRLPSPDSAPVWLTVGLPASAVYQGVNDALRNTLIVLALWLLLVAALAWWATDRFVLRDVRAIVTATERLGSGDLSVRTGRTAETGELGRLAASFDQMAERLEERQSRAVQAQKLESIGQLAGGVAHDFNNLLTAIIGNAELARDSLDPSHPARVELDAALGAADRSAALTRQLLAFARRTELAPRVVRVDRLLGDVTALLKRLIGEHISLAVEIDPELHLARVDTTSVEQAIVNLAVNARDAMPRGGQLVITARNVNVSSGDIDHAHGVPVGPWIMLSVRDTGAGMSADVLGRAFEPFFTTKPVGKGTGLGLAMVYGTVVQHDGHVWVESAPGHGTSVRLFLPPAPEGSVVEMTVPKRVTSPPSRGRAIMLVEDEPAVRAVVSRILVERGFEVISAVDGDDAIAQCDDRLLTRLALVVSDVVMPRRGGPELITSLRARRPDLPVLFVSGYREDHTLDALLEAPSTGFLEKPFTPSALLQAVHQLLEGAKTSDAPSTPV